VDSAHHQPSTSSPPVGVEQQSALRSTLHKRGLRMTPQRQLVLDAVRALEHATPEQICQQVQRTASGVNISTIYRALELLEELSLVRHTHLGHGAPTYSAFAHEHVHLVCHRCERMHEVATDLLDDLSGTLRARYGFVLDASHLALSGLCVDCADQELS
jgi:Fur family transcriptional regulator, ferric uptake regulator